jgi:SAM-dependent methyltransferase
MYRAAQSWLPAGLRRHLLFFEHRIEVEVRAFARSLPARAVVLDAGAGETRHAAEFAAQRYVGVDLAVGDQTWDYSQLSALADLTALPFPAATFDAALNIVTLEHLPEPQAALREIARVLKSGAPLLVIAPHEWEVHQAPHDYFRYTRHGLEYLLTRAGFVIERMEPVGGLFRLLSRRLLNALQFFPGPLFFVAALLLAPLALFLPWCDSLDRRRDFTLGYTCLARRSPSC